MNKKYENEKQYGLEITWDPDHYNPIIHGTVEVIRIFYSENTTKDILAELRFCFGGTTIIEWTNPDEREKFADGIDGYTLFLDERVIVDNYKAEELLSDKLHKVDHEISEAWKKYYKNRSRYQNYLHQKFLISKDPLALMNPYKARHYAKRVLFNTLENKITEKARIQHDLDELRNLLNHNDEEGNELPKEEN